MKPWRPIPAHSIWFTVLLGVFAGLPALTIDLSAPTLVQLPAALGTTIMVSGLTLSLFMVGFAIGLLAGGRISDRSGRRPVLLAGLAIYVVAGAACVAALSGPALVFARLVQGVGAGACAVQAFAMVQDLFEGEAARSKRSYVATLVGAIPVLAPALGAWLSAAAGWRSVHTVLAGAGLILLLVVWALVGESRPARTRAIAVPTQPGARLRDDRRFQALVAVNALSYGALFAYIAGAPVVIMGELGYGPTGYAVAFACTASALFMGAWLSGALGRLGTGASVLTSRGLLLQAAATVMLALSSRAGDGPILLVLLMLTCFARGIAAPNMMHLAISPRYHDAGLASAVYGVVQLLAGAAAGAGVSALLPYVHQTAVAAPMALLSGAAAALWLAASRLGANGRARPVTE